ncbi:hypothetical protein KC19_7G057800 [Ceratodon purpureus]|uniref:Uncharacterized protein n=1 Tax=Ceratodon purpureus TaxID=3225 RepID=A0A8T0H808_CERPU|nr:hypothetical protein KC19_7G057800 [Ceratodon purpureus]
MDSGQSSTPTVDSERRSRLLEYLSKWLSDFPPVSVLYLATDPDFENLLGFVFYWYERATNHLQSTAGLETNEQPLMPIALTLGWEYLLRALCRACTPTRLMCTEVETPENSSVEEAYLRQMLINERLKVMALIEVLEFFMFVVVRGPEKLGYFESQS